MAEESIDFFPIRIEQTDWNSSSEVLSRIRQRVFIDEQQVPIAEEFDEADSSAIHWIAWDEDNLPMGVARLVGNKLGRMAVLEAYRRKGVASALVRSIVAFAIAEKMTNLVLDAQLHAVRLYESYGFTVTGEEFLDVGIPHLPMAVDLSRFIQHRKPPSPPEIDDELRERKLLDNPHDCHTAALNIAQHGARTLRIFSTQLDPRLYDTDEFCQAVHNLVVAHPQTKVTILVKDTEALAKYFHRLVATYHRLPSHIELRKLTREIPTSHEEFMTADIAPVLYLQDPRRCVGYYCLHSPLEAKTLNEEFDNLWNHSLPDPQIRQLHI